MKYHLYEEIIVHKTNIKIQKLAFIAILFLEITTVKLWLKKQSPTVETLNTDSYENYWYHWYLNEIPLVWKDDSW